MFPVRRPGLTMLLGLAALCSLSAHAQVYRIVGPDGKVTFSDRPPPDGKATPAKTVAMPADSGANLPFELRGVTAKYPVTLYTGPECQACNGARSFLQSRGVPFTERTVSSEDDIDALKRIAGAARLPFLTIGGQQMRGFSQTEWSQYLDAAGYPKTSQLPSGYRNPPASPLVTAQQIERPAAPQRPAAQRPQRQEAAPPQEEPPPPNPAGIRF
jgi:glutaredoxin